jgi:hypothetical protein
MMKSRNSNSIYEYRGLKPLVLPTSNTLQIPFGPARDQGDLHIATQIGCMTTINKLIEEKTCDIDILDNVGSCTPFTEYIFNCGFCILQCHHTSLHYAAMYGQTAIAHELITAGANVDARDAVPTTTAFLYQTPRNLSRAYT